MKKRLHVLIDGRTFALQSKGGVSQLWAKILQEKSLRDQFTISMILYPNSRQNIHLQELLETVGTEFHIIESTLPPSDNNKYAEKKYCQQRESEIAAAIRNKVDLVLNTYYGENIFPQCASYLIVAHDFAHEELEILAAKESTRGVLQRKATAFSAATAIINVSRQTQKKGMSLYSQYKDRKNFVIYHGHDTDMEAPLKVHKQIIHVGGRGLYKNFFQVRQALDNLMRHDNEVSVIIAGGENIDAGISELVSSFSPKVLFSSGMPDAQMNFLMGSSQVFVSGSTYEGFGIPVLNALRLGVIPVLSDIPIYREIAGKDGIFFDPQNPKDIEEKIQNALAITSGPVGKYYRPWGQVALEYGQVIREVANGY
ncbi:glycosyltransferase [Roseobacter sp. N2S]|uniref:glycosyltransferase n=1 Tax=Roseobacter sp. N2S TaxID=2663844 RepID=UPI002866FD35|nr:glycosyltransferase [Roseobacter sp. N2S]MDR6267575.1 glycosyltransferase involved in cell wall biosynthesis [Roseobacter sp. N2S]